MKVTSRAWTCLLHLLILLAFAASGMNAFAEPTWEGVVSVETAEISAPIIEEPVWTAELPPLTAEQVSRLEYWLDRTGLPGPMVERTEEGVCPCAPEPGSESVAADRVNAPGDPKLLLKIDFGSKIPSGYKSNVMESSVGTAGKWVFFTGNWFAARTTKGGGKKLKHWEYISSFTGFPDFCCDQIAIYDESRNRYFWLRMGMPDTDPSTGNYENVFKLSVSKNGMKKYWTYTTKPTDVNSGWTNQWWDYPHIQLGADYMYIAWNMFNESGFWTRTVMLRWPLDELATGSGFSYNYYSQSDWFTFVPVQGTWHTMYWASNWRTDMTPDRHIRIWKWDEDSTTLYYVTREVTPWTPTGRGDAHCGDPGNWAGRYDQRALSGARYTINSDGIVDPRIPGRKIVAWWWNVAEGGDFAHPYIDAAAFNEDTLVQVGGWLGRPYVWSPDHCFAYPSVTPNKRQDLGMVFHYAQAEEFNPGVAYSIADDFVSAPPGWTFYPVQASSTTPSDDQWGDYNTVREFEPTQKVWVAGSHYIPSSTPCSNCSEPVYFVFGRERDEQSFKRWFKK